MGVYTEAELDYLAAQYLMRFATASSTGKPDIAPVGFTLVGDDIVSGGFDITRTVRYKNVQKNPRAAVVIDDLATIDPWTPRGIKVIGNVTIEEVDGSPRFRIRPDVIISWGVNVTSPGRPTMERRSVS